MGGNPEHPANADIGFNDNWVMTKIGLMAKVRCNGMRDK